MSTSTIRVMHDVKKAAAAVRLLPTLLVRAARRLPPGDRLGRRLGRIWRLSVLRLVVEGALADARRLPVALVRDLPLAYGAVPHATGVEREETDKADFEPHALLRVHDRGVAAPRAHARAEVLGGLDDGRAPDDYARCAQRQGPAVSLTRARMTTGGADAPISSWLQEEVWRCG